jgi:hypothetical protein
MKSYYTAALQATAPPQQQNMTALLAIPFLNLSHSASNFYKGPIT